MLIKASSVCSSLAKKPGLRKALQFEADPYDCSAEGQSSEALGASLSSLGNLVGLVAETSEERYRLLDQRDKIMRQGNDTIYERNICCSAGTKEAFGVCRRAFAIVR